MSTKTLAHERIADYLTELARKREPEYLARLRERTATMAEGEMQLSPEQSQLLALLVRITGAQRAIEAGTFTGYSSCCVAEALGPDGRLVCCDVSEEWTEIAREAWREADVEERCYLRIGPAEESLAGMIDADEAGTYDLAFVDADKPGYPGYYEQLLVLLRPGGVIAFDNMFRGGGVFAEPGTERGDEPGNAALRELNRSLYEDERVEPVLLPLGDGLMVVRKR